MFLGNRLSHYVHSANKPMKRYFTFSMNPMLWWNYGINQIYFSMFVFNFHSFYHRQPFLDFLIHYNFFGFFNTYSNNLILENHIILLIEIYLHNSRKQEKVTLRKLIRIIIKVKNIEKESAGNHNKKIMLYRKEIAKKLKICYFLKK